MPNCSPVHIFLCSKTIPQILAWVTLLAALYSTATIGLSHLFVQVYEDENRNSTTSAGRFWTSASSKVIFKLALIFFPLGGILGDVYWGRYKAVVSGLVVTAVSMVIGTAGSLLWAKEDWIRDPNIHRLVAIPVVATLILCIFGFALVTSNTIQFGLDQLIEKPSESLGVFVHWAVWAGKLGMLIVSILHASTYCPKGEAEVVITWFVHAVSILFLLLLILFLIIAYCTRRYFNRDRVKYNPYKMIFRVLNFARKNKYPVGPVSAFAHCYDYRPSRLDYAKERYGGPFTTSDVEDVKAFKNVFLVLLALGPIYTLDIPAESIIFSKLSTHIGDGFLSQICEGRFKMGTITPLANVILFPLYMWLVYSVFRKKPIKIFHRLTLGLVFFIVSVVMMLVIDLAGHATLDAQNQTQPMCMFVQDESFSETLNIHWIVLIIPGVAKGFSDHIIMATSFEFISAQSPHTMQGVLVGSTFALQGIFYALGGFALVPFTLKRIWVDGYLGQHLPVISCGFGYYLVCITVAMIGFISFIIAVKRYKYRRRDEEPYSQACVEEIFARRIESRGRYSDYEELSGTNEY